MRVGSQSRLSGIGCDMMQALENGAGIPRNKRREGPFSIPPPDWSNGETEVAGWSAGWAREAGIGSGVPKYLTSGSGLRRRFEWHWSTSSGEFEGGPVANCRRSLHRIAAPLAAGGICQDGCLARLGWTVRTTTYEQAPALAKWSHDLESQGRSTLRVLVSVIGGYGPTPFHLIALLAAAAMTSDMRCPLGRRASHEV